MFRHAVCITTVLLILSGILASRPAAGNGTAADRAKAEYATNCAGCHGLHGRGDGLLTKPEPWRDMEGADPGRKPRDFSRDWFRYGDSREAIIRTINQGAPGSAMQVYPDVYPPDVAAALADIVLGLRRPLSNAVIRQRFPDRIPKSTGQPGFPHGRRRLPTH